MRWLLTVYALLILCGEAAAQGLHDSRGNMDIHIVPLTLIDRNPRLRLGFEFHGFNKLGYSLELGWGNHLFNDLSLLEAIWGDHYSFFEIHPEIKWYAFESGRMEKYYGAELFYSYLSDILTTNDYIEQSTGHNIFFESASIRRHKIGLLLKVGTKWHFGNRLVFDLSSGIGVAYREISYSDEVNPQVDDLKLQEWFIPPYKKEGKYIIPQVSFGFKLGYVVNKKL